MLVMISQPEDQERNTEFKIVCRSELGMVTVAGNTETDLLSSMRESGWPMRRACRNGSCGICQCKLSGGEVTYGSRKPHGLWQKDIDLGLILPCIAFPLSDTLLTEVSLENTCRGND